MAKRSPRRISASQLLARRDRIVRIARAVGFVGDVEYRHVYSQTGGAQYGRGSTEEVDLLTVYAEAFERDTDPEEFSRSDNQPRTRPSTPGPASSHREARRGRIRGE